MKKTIATIIVIIFAVAIFTGCEKKESEPDSVYSVTELCFFKGETKIYGNLYAPTDKKEKHPAVILSHSANVNSDSLRSYAKGFAERGYIAYAFDFCGGSGTSRSDGEKDYMTVFTECDDLLAVIDGIKNLTCVDSSSLFLFGTSQGGLISALVAEKRADIAGLILLYPAFNIPELASSYGFGTSPFIDTLKNFDIYSSIGKFDKNVLILHGSLDFIVKKSYSERASELYNNCTLHIIKGAGHGFNADNFSIFGDFDNEVWEYIDEYLNIAYSEKIS